MKIFMRLGSHFMSPLSVRHGDTSRPENIQVPPNYPGIKAYLTKCYVPVCIFNARWKELWRCRISSAQAGGWPSAYGHVKSTIPGVGGLGGRLIHVWTGRVDAIYPSAVIFDRFAFYLDRSYGQLLICHKCQIKISPERWLTAPKFNWTLFKLR